MILRKIPAESCKLSWTGSNPLPSELQVSRFPSRMSTRCCRAPTRPCRKLCLSFRHFDSRPSNVMDPEADAPGADDDASGAAVSVECARLLSKASAKSSGYRATILFATVSGEEQGLLGSTHLVDWVKQQGYTVGGMLDDDIVGADPTPGGPHRVRLFSGNGEIDDCDAPARELARAIEEIDGRNAIRLIFRQDRYGRGGDHYPFYKIGRA